MKNAELDPIVYQRMLVALKRIAGLELGAFPDAQDFKALCLAYRKEAFEALLEARAFTGWQT